MPPIDPVLQNPDEVLWQKKDPQTEMALLRGVPGDPGLYTLRVKLHPSESDGRPHWHPTDEFGTILSGTLLVSAGKRTDRGSAKLLRPGAFIVIPATVHHAIWPQGEVVLQIHALGPRITNYE